MKKLRHWALSPAMWIFLGIFVLAATLYYLNRPTIEVRRIWLGENVQQIMESFGEFVNYQNELANEPPCNLRFKYVVFLNRFSVKKFSYEKDHPDSLVLPMIGRDPERVRCFIFTDSIPPESLKYYRAYE